MIAIAPVKPSEAGPEHLLLELWDDSIRSIVEVIVLEVTDSTGVERAFDIDLNLMRTDRASYTFEAEDCTLLSRLCGVVLDGSRGRVRLIAWSDVDALPYQIHTNRELAMMLAGTKPLAMFYENVPADGVWTIPEDLFELHVASGRFVQRDLVWLDKRLPPGVKGIRYVFYSLAVEAWRIDAFIALKTAAALSGYGSETLERLEGALFGYAEWQNAAHLVKWRTRRTSNANEQAA
jgi:hypothetical protein